MTTTSIPITPPLWFKLAIIVSGALVIGGFLIGACGRIETAAVGISLGGALSIIAMAMRHGPRIIQTMRDGSPQAQLVMDRVLIGDTAYPLNILIARLRSDRIELVQTRDGGSATVGWLADTPEHRAACGLT